jgi:hypothetical protein
VDDFESGVNTWTSAKDAGSLSHANAGIVGSANPSYGAYALGVTGEAWAETGSSPYTGFSSFAKTFASADLSAYTSFDFSIAENITFVPYYGGPVTYKVRIQSGSNSIEAVTTAATGVMTNRSIMLSSFALPSGATGYTVASVLANADTVAFEVSIQSSYYNDWIGYEIYLDNIEFKM